MNKIYKGCFVKCIKENNLFDTPKTVVGATYEVLDYRAYGWVMLKGTNLPRDRFKFAIKRFEFYQEDGKMYPTINKKYFKE